MNLPIEAQVYNLVVKDAGKTQIDKLARELNMKPSSFQAALFRHVSRNGLSTPVIKWEEEKRPPRPARVFSRGHDKQGLNVTAARLNYYGFGDALSWETFKVEASVQNPLYVEKDGAMVALTLPEGALLLVPVREPMSVQEEQEEGSEAPDTVDPEAEPEAQENENPLSVNALTRALATSGL